MTDEVLIMKKFITAQKALQLTNCNQLSGVDNNRQPLLNDLATIISDAITANAKLGFQHVFINYKQDDILECLHQHNAQIQDLPILFKEVIDVILNKPNPKPGDYIFRHEYTCTDTPGIENTYGWYIVWGQLNVNDGINGGTDLD